MDCVTLAPKLLLSSVPGSAPSQLFPPPAFSPRNPSVVVGRPATFVVRALKDEQESLPPTPTPNIGFDGKLPLFGMDAPFVMLCFLSVSFHDQFGRRSRV